MYLTQVNASALTCVKYMIPLGLNRPKTGAPSQEATLGGFELLEHTADVGVVATGDTLAEALSWVAVGMFSVIADLDNVEPRESIEVSVSSTGTDTLVVDWLNELLYTYEAKGFLPKEFQVSVDEPGDSLVAQCAGEPLDPERHSILIIVKAATYHNLQVSHNGQWRIQVILDV